VAASLVHAQHSLSAKWISYVGAENGGDTVYAIASDSRTNAYFGGVLGFGALADVNGVGTVDGLGMSGDGDGDGFVAKVAADGTLQWSTSLTYGNGSEVLGLAYSDGAVYAGGAFSNYDDYDWFFDVFLDTRVDAILTKLDADTGAVLWSHSLGEGESADNFCTDSAYWAVAVGKDGSIYAAGSTMITNLQTFLPDSIHAGGADAVVVKYTPNGTVEWVRYLGGPGEDRATAVAVGADGSVYVAGTTMGGSSVSGFFAKLDTDGTVIYSTPLKGSGGWDSVSALLADASSGTLILAGYTLSSDFCSGAAVNTWPGGGGNGFVMSMTDLGASCATNWLRFVGGSSDVSTVTTLAWMDNGQVIAGGTTSNGGWLAPQGEAALGYSGGFDGFLLQLNKATGAPLWSTYVGGAKDDAVHALAVVGEAVFVGGDTFSPGFAYDGFWDEWEKSDLFGPIGTYGFIGKWTQGVGDPPLITTDLSDLIIHEGQNASFSLIVQATPSPSYYWSTNGIPVTGAANQYTIYSAKPSDDNTMVCCVVSNIFGSVTSHVARLTVIANGSLTVSLTPPQAVTQGAKWSVDGGATWLNSGATLTLYPDDYTVTFPNVAGWTTPTSQPVTVLPGGAASSAAAYTPILATASRAIADTNVTLTVQMPPEVTGWELVETLPNNLTPTLYSPGVWDSTARTLTFTGTTSTALTYTTTASVSGTYAVSGQLASTPSGLSTNVTGDTQIISANLLRVINGTQVTIHVKHPPGAFFWQIFDYMPPGLTVDVQSVTDPSWTGSATMVFFMSMSGVGTTLSYEVTGPPGEYQLSQGSGLIWGVGLAEPIFGDSVIVIPDPNQPVVKPDILAFSIQGATGTLTFTSAVNQAYMVLTNATLALPNGWHDCLPVTGTGPTTTINVPTTLPQLFYRIETR